MSRRARRAAVVVALLACVVALFVFVHARGREPAASTARPNPQLVLAASSPSTATVLALVELPRQELTSTLSGAYYDAGSRTLRLVQDRHPRLISLIAAADLRSFSVGAPLALHGRPESTWDGEAVAHAGGELFVVTIESAARIERFDHAGRYLGTLSVPARLAEQAVSNKGLESLTAAPSGRALFTANESALETDGPRASATAGTLVRIVKLPLPHGPAEERAYRTEALGAGQGGGMGVSDLAALSDDTLLVLERGFQPGYGNTVRIFRVDFASAPDVGARTALGADAPQLKKTLVVDLAALPSAGVAHHSPQPNPLLENYESLALGPSQPDGTRIVLLASDDNANDAQRPRVLVLALRLPP
jgi:hypothetical protein